MSSLFSSLFGRKPEPAGPSFEEWLATTTQPEIQELFLQVLKEGDADDGMGKRLSDEELTHFKHTVFSLAGDLTQSPDTSISPEIVISHLVECHPQHAKAINSSSNLLARLLRAHAAFPFPANFSEDLTQPALLRAILLLTAHCKPLFGAAGSIGGEVTIRGRKPEQRIAFIFSALASPPAIPSMDDLLDVLCRVPYPRIRDRKTGDLRREFLVDLIPLAERLHGTEKNHKDSVETGHVSAAAYEQLAYLVASLHGTSVVEGLAQAEIDIDTFEKWAIKADLLGALDKLFACFLRE